MIIKIDHLAYSSSDINADIEHFSKLDYKLNFLEKNLENLSTKQTLLNNYEKTHDLALMTKNNSYNIELLNHNNVNKQNGFIKPLNLSGDTFNKIIIDTDNIQRSIIFWKLLGFSETELIEGKQELVFSSPLTPNAFYIYLNYNNTIKKKLLDDNNYNCIALITNSVLREKDHLDSHGFTTTKIEELRVNNQTLKIFFVQRDNCEIAEVIEIKR